MARECRAWFVGVWDTVSSVGWVDNPLKLPSSADNGDIQVGRHAIAIDEKRARSTPTRQRLTCIVGGTNDPFRSQGAAGRKVSEPGSGGPRSVRHDDDYLRR